MTVTKFDHLNIPTFQGIITGEFTTGVPSWWVMIMENGTTNEYRLFDGDYIICDDNGVCIKYISSTDYAADLVLQNIVREAIGKELIRSIWASLLSSGLTDAQKVGVANKIAVVLIMIQCAVIVGARFLANTITTDANFTAGVKTALLNLMDIQIAKL